MSLQIKSDQKLEQILINFIDVLRINILMVDIQGKPILIPQMNGYGFKGSNKWGILKHLGTVEFLSKFKTEGLYLRTTDEFQFNTFAIPVGFHGYPIIGYLVIGPVILGKQQDQGTYQTIAKSLKINSLDFNEYLSEIRIVSFNSLKSILDLLFELSQYAIKTNTQKTPVEKKITQQSEISVFNTLLELSMALTSTECGSIMLYDKKTKKLNMEAYKGLDSQQLNGLSINLGEGIAGLAAQKKRTFVLNSQNPDNRISHLLKKPEIKCSIVLPIVGNRKEILGVLSVSTRQEDSRLFLHSKNLIKSLSGITSNTVEQLQ